MLVRLPMTAVNGLPGLSALSNNDMALESLETLSKCQQIFKNASAYRRHISHTYSDTRYQHILTFCIVVGFERGIVEAAC
jgi:hypothetical protein